MIEGRMGEWSRRLAVVADQRIVVPRGERKFHKAVELARPRVRFGVNIDRRQVMDKIAAAEDENSLIAQGRQLPADLILPGGRQIIIQTHLHNGNIRPRVHLCQDRPRAVVQTPFIIQLHPGGGDGFGDPRGGFRSAGGGIAVFFQRFWKPVKIVDRARLRHPRDGRPLGEPVGGDGKNGLWFGQRLPQAFPVAGEGVIVERVFRRAVADEDNRHAPAGGRGMHRGHGSSLLLAVDNNTARRRTNRRAPVSKEAVIARRRGRMVFRQGRRSNLPCFRICLLEEIAAPLPLRLKPRLARQGSIFRLST